MRTYPYELKLKVVEKYFEGVSADELTRRYELKNPRRVYDWVEKVNKGGYEALKSQKGKHSKGRSKKETESLAKQYEWLKLENEYLKMMAGCKKAINDKSIKYEFIHEHVTQYPITTLVEITQVSRSGYYKWLRRNSGDSK